jgi:hypothetical protein
VGLNVSVPEYTYMHTEHGIGGRFSPAETGREGEDGLTAKPTTNQDGDRELLARTQAAIELAVEQAGGREAVLALDETDLDHLSWPIMLAHSQGQD